jgi:hypothetical protein
MSARVCVVCGEPLPSWSRVDKTTCNPGCRTRLCRTRKAACNSSVTRSGATEPRSGGQTNDVPVSPQTEPLAASGKSVPSSSGSASAGGLAGHVPALVPAYDPLVTALAQLVRDRWAAEQVSSDGPVALGAVPSIMATMGKQDSDGKEAPA